MNLDEAQKKMVAGWIDEGLKLSDIQKRISSDLGLSLTYMDVRLLVDDLKLIPKDPTPPPAQKTAEPSPKPAESLTPPVPPAPKPPLTPPATGGLTVSKISVGVDTVARPGAMVSGSVTFSDGQKGSWYMDQYGRLGVAPEQQGYKPSQSDVQAFQMELEKELTKFGF